MLQWECQHDEEYLLAMMFRSAGRRAVLTQAGFVHGVQCHRDAPGVAGRNGGERSWGGFLGLPSSTSRGDAGLRV